MARDTKKIIQTLTYFAYQMPDRIIDNMKAFKLLWLADRCHLRQNGRTITGDNYYALPKGMVPTDAKHLLDGQPTVLTNPDGYFDRWIERVGGAKYKALQSPDENEFSQSDIKVLQTVFREYGAKSANSLSRLSHKYPEWREYEDMLSDKSQKNAFPINIDLMFANCDTDPSPLFNQSSEMLEMTKEIYHELN